MPEKTISARKSFAIGLAAMLIESILFFEVGQTPFHTEGFRRPLCGYWRCSDGHF